MLSLVTLDNGKGEAVVLHEDAPASVRLLVDAKGLVGIGPLRQSKRVRPQAHGSIDETRFEEGRTIQLTMEVWGTTIQKCMEEMRKVTQPMLETLDGAPALLKWTEATAGFKLQMRVTLDSEVEPVLKGATGYVTFPVQLFAEDPRAYTQTLTTETGAGITGAAAEAGFVATSVGALGIAVDAGHIYWANLNGKAIGRAAIGGGTLEPEWIKTTSTPASVAVDAGHIYWGTNTIPGLIGRATIAGATIENSWISGITGPVYGIAVNAANIFWHSFHGATSDIGKAAIAGTGVEREWLSIPLGMGGGMAVDAGHIYFANTGAIGRSTLAGGSIEPEWITGVTAQGLFINASNIFWSNTTARTIGRAAIAGTGANQAFISLGGENHPYGLAGNTEHLYWAEREPGAGAIGRSGTLAGGPSGGAITIAQAGNRPTPLTFKIHGPIENPSITRESDGSRIALNGSIASGNYVEVNTAERTVKLNGLTNSLSMLNAQGTNWEAFSPLASTKYLLTGTSATAAFMEALYRSAYA